MLAYSVAVGPGLGSGLALESGLVLTLTLTLTLTPRALTLHPSIHASRVILAQLACSVALAEVASSKG